MSIHEKIRKIGQDEQMRIKKEEKNAKDFAKKQRDEQEAKWDACKNYEKRTLKYCDKMANSLGIYEGIIELGKKMGKKSKVKNYSPCNYFGKKIQIFEFRDRPEVFIEVDVLHHLRKIDENNTSKEVKEILSKKITDFSIFYSFDEDRDAYEFESCNTTPAKLEIEIVDLGHDKFNLKNTSSKYKRYNFEKDNVSAEELREISDTILAYMYIAEKTKGYPYKLHEKVLGEIKEKVFGS